MKVARRTPSVARRSAGQVRPDEPLRSLTKEAAMCTTAPSGWASPRVPHARRPRWWLAGQPIPRLPLDELRPGTGLAPGGDPAQGAAAVPPIAQPKRPAGQHPVRRQRRSAPWRPAASGQRRRRSCPHALRVCHAAEDDGARGLARSMVQARGGSSRHALPQRRPLRGAMRGSTGARDGATTRA
jgi:hypothetical protein